MQNRPTSSATDAKEAEFAAMDAYRKQLEEEMSQLLATHHQTSLQRSTWNTRLKDLRSGDKLPESLTFFDYFLEKKKLHATVVTKLHEYLAVLKNSDYQNWLRANQNREAELRTQNLRSEQAAIARCELFRARIEMGIDVYEEGERVVKRPF